MTGSAALDILIGLFTLYFVMSTLASAIVELVGSILALRSKMLKSFLEFQFYKTVYQNNGSISESMHNFLEEIVEAAKRLWKQNEYEPNSENFALDLDKFYQIVKAKKPSPLEILPFGKKLLPTINKENFAQTLNVLIGLTGDRTDIPKLYQSELNKLSEMGKKFLDLSPADPNNPDRDKDINAVLTNLETAKSGITGIADQIKQAQSAQAQTLDDIKSAKTEVEKKAANDRQQQNTNQLNILFDQLKGQIKTLLDSLQQPVDNIKKSNNFPTLVNTFDSMRNNLQAINRIGTNPMDANIEDLKVLVSTLPESQIRNTLINAIQQTAVTVDNAEQTINDVTMHVAKWFDGEMERLTNTYKRRTQLFLFIAGVVVSFYLNVDTIAIANALAKNPALRDAVVEQAKSITNDADINALTATNTAADKLTWKQALEQLNGLALPIGWDPVCGNDTMVATGQLIADTRPCQDFGSETGSALPGILITAAAVALGAPFWFDLLKSLTSGSGGSKDEADAKKT